MFLIDSSAWIEYLRPKVSLPVKEYLSALPQIPLDEAVVLKAAEWGFLLDSKNKKVPTTDLIIGASAYKRATVLHCDSDFDLLAKLFGLAQENCR